MLDLLLKLTRIGVVVFWIAALLSLFAVVPGPYASVITWFAGLVLLIHLAEYFCVRRRFAGVAGREISFFQTLFFGLMYWVPIVVSPIEDGGETGRAGITSATAPDFETEPDQLP